jgi:hypothetical protein
MRGLKVMLFGIALVCFSGFYLVADALGVVTESVFTWGMLFGLLVSFLGLLVNDGSAAESGGRAEKANRPDDGGGSDDGEEDAEKQPNDYRANRFPPM